MSDGSNSQDNELPDAEITVGNYRLDRTIGQGTYGKVRLGVHTRTFEKISPD
jgi:hypothetical protein